MARRGPVTYVRWATMWHVMKDQGETYCGRFVMPGAERRSTRDWGLEGDGITWSMICAVCREYL